MNVVHFKWMGCIYQELYLNKAVTKTSNGSGFSPSHITQGPTLRWNLGLPKPLQLHLFSPSLNKPASLSSNLSSTLQSSPHPGTLNLPIPYLGCSCLAWGTLSHCPGVNPPPPASRPHHPASLQDPPLHSFSVILSCPS